MANGQSAAFADAALDAGLAANRWVQLHTGAPGASGTANVAGNTVRMQATWNSAASGSATNNGDIVWTSVSTSETYADATLWSASTGGTFGGSGTVTSSAITSTNNFKIASGGLSVSYTLAT